jgi:hypothetical protein
MATENNKKPNPKKFIYFTDLLFLIGLVSLMTLANIIFDPEKTDWKKWLTQTVVLTSIEIAALVLGELMGADRNIEDENGRYQACVAKYAAAFDAIKDILVYFSQFFVWYKKDDSHNLRLGILMSKAEIDGEEAVLILKYLKMSEVDSLFVNDIVKKEDGKTILLFKLERSKEDLEVKHHKKGHEENSKAQIIKDVLAGKYDVKKDSYAYFLSVDADSDSAMSLLDQGDHIEYLREKNRRFSRTWKIGSGIVFSIIFAALAIEDNRNGDQVTMWINLVERFISLAGGFTCGWTTSMQDIKLASNEIITKKIVLEMFRTDYDKHIFVPKTYDETVSEKLKAIEQEEEKKEKEEKIDNSEKPSNLSQDKKPLLIGATLKEGNQ